MTQSTLMGSFLPDRQRVVCNRRPFLSRLDFGHWAPHAADCRSMRAEPPQTAGMHNSCVTRNSLRRPSGAHKLTLCRRYSDCLRNSARILRVPPALALSKAFDEIPQLAMTCAPVRKGADESIAGPRYACALRLATPALCKNSTTRLARAKYRYSHSHAIPCLIPRVS